MGDRDRRHVMRIVLTIALLLGTIGLRVRADEAPVTRNPHGSLHEACAECHTANAWRPARITTRFDHARFGFPLEGAHRAAACLACHRTLEFSRTEARCVDCHTDPHRSELGLDCARCHGARSFLERGPMVRAHQSTRFPLTGAHAVIECEGCHASSEQGHLRFVGTPLACLGCHRSQFEAAKQPDHVAGHLPTDCTNCHTTTFWSKAHFDHDHTRFPLTGQHRTVACTACHTTGRFVAIDTACLSCHQANWNTATPNHPAAGFDASQCASCHNTTAWHPGAFDHTARTSFPLTGAHTTRTCNDCHGDNVFAGKSTACIDCHRATYDSATPNHVASGFPAAACADCHNTTQWSGATFDHDTKTSFPLTGAHVARACTECHGDGVYVGKSTACLSCHQANWTAATPNHAAAGFDASQCASCHNTTAWNPGAFDHTARTSFPLTGAHTTRACMDCHGDNVFVGKPTACISCHQANYDTATPNHVAANFPAAQCTTCHNTTQWAGATFNHDSSWFPIYSGTHLGRWSACANCHPVATDFSQFTCLSCHPHDDKTTTDGHHSAVRNYVYASPNCYACHPRGTH